jgi:CMP-N,N'-diacetyllegionaminic acid synthase
VVLLSATTPLTRPADVRRALALFRAGRGAAVIAVTPERAAPSWRFTLAGRRLRAPAGRRVRRRQESAGTYLLNGAIYVATPGWLRRHGQFWATGALGVVIPPERSLDIETAFDLELARLLVDGTRRPSRRR